MLKKYVFLGIFLGAFTWFASADHTYSFKVRIENVSKPDILKSSTGATASLAFSPGVYIVHKSSGPVFVPGHKDHGLGLEHQAEDGDPTSLAKSLTGAKGIMTVGVFDTPVGANDPGPIRPGEAYEFLFVAENLASLKLTIVQMWGQSNDLFYAPGPQGISLFDSNGTPISGDITSQFQLWDAGTEVNQEPGFGPDQGPRQKGPNTGPAESNPVGPVKDSYTYPPAAQVLRVTITHQ